jgi:hypothetical protein
LTFSRKARKMPTMLDKWRGPVVGLLVLGATAALALNVVKLSSSPDGAWVVELSDWGNPTQIELRSQRIPETHWRKVGSQLRPDYDVSSFLISDNSLHVVYREGRTATGDWVLYSAPILGFATGTLISQPQVPGGSVLPGFHLISGNRVRYQYTPDGGPSAWYVVQATGGRILAEIFSDGFEGGGVTKWK